MATMHIYITNFYSFAISFTFKYDWMTYLFNKTNNGAFVHDLRYPSTYGPDYKRYVTIVTKDMVIY